jgi:hypothetical protein
MKKTTFSEQIDFLIFTGGIEGHAILTLYNLLKSYEQGWISAKEMQDEINSFNPDFYLEVLQNEKC